MWNRKQLKTKAGINIKKNYKAAVAVCFIIAFIAGAYGISTWTITQYNTLRTEVETVLGDTKGDTNADIINLIIKRIVPDTEKDPLEGIKGFIINMFTGPSNTIMKTIDAAEMFMEHYFRLGIFIIVGGILQILYYLFIKNILLVGEKRFFLENRIYGDTKILSILYIYRKKKTVRTLKTMFIKDLYTVLWFFTIIGGFIKLYSYKMIPYIIAENPDVDYKEAFYRSKEMMKGNKWRAFLFDVSFFWWYILSILTFGLVGFFWLNPYKTAAEAELFIVLRNAAADIHYHEHQPENMDIHHGIPHNEPLHFLKEIHYDQKYSIAALILMFFTFSCLGWIWEVFLGLVKDGIFANRGTMYGPWLPIYGSGILLILIFFRKIFKHVIYTFFTMMIVSGIIEYFTSYYLEVTRGEKWWDYSGYLLNLHGRICLEGLIIFGLGGCACVYFIAPRLNMLFEKIPRDKKIMICVVLISLFFIDWAYSFFNPNTGRGITTGHGIMESNGKDIIAESGGKNIITERGGYGLNGRNAAGCEMRRVL